MRYVWITVCTLLGCGMMLDVLPMKEVLREEPVRVILGTICIATGSIIYFCGGKE
jgi:hypothetical protein